MPDVWKDTRDDIVTAFAIDSQGLRSDASALSTRLNSNPDPNWIYGGSSLKDVVDWIPLLDDFDASSIGEDPTVSARHIEQSLNDLARLVTTCDDIKAKFGEMARNYLEARIKIEEFLRNDEIHKKEVEAGVYELPWHEAAGELEVLDVRIRHLQQQRGWSEASLDTGIFTLIEPGIERARDNARKSKGYDERDVVAFNTGELAKLDYGIQASSWKAGLYAIHTEHEFARASRYHMALRADYLKKDATFRLHRTMVARDLTYRRLREHIRRAAELNYPERMESIRALFRAYLVQIIKRIRAIYRGAPLYYGINVPEPSFRTGYAFEQAKRWVAEVSERVLLRQRRESLELLTFSIRSQLGDGKDFLESLHNGVQFAIGNNGKLEGNLRGAAFEYLGDGSIPITVVAEPPAGAVIEGGSIGLAV